MESEKNHGNGRRGRPNYDVAFRQRLAAAACEPGVSVSKRAREHGINANMLFKWRRKYRAQLAIEPAPLLPVTLVSDARGSRACRARARPISAEVQRDPGTIEVRIGKAAVKVSGSVDAQVLRTVLEAFR
ncbi:IS66-like element accessory protein TnpA [Pandoraea sputorum]|uniref:Transposase n=1 Tax=Pandoraea sputorum TaxID=93222 RepID=A0A5E5BHJ2_9BURK|nr:transposase [Pandoraea sputorum]VVE84495.1 transposase [Pandoraea sputorum]